MRAYTDSTLKGYTKEQLIGIIRCLEHNVKATEERNENQFAMLMEREKYRWHNLRKNPDDLPKVEGCVIVSLNGYYGKTIYEHGIDMAYWVEDGKFYDDIGMNQLVEAWKEIEPFSRLHENDKTGKGWRSC